MNTTKEAPRGWPSYEVDADQATERRTLPVVIGVLADLSGYPEQPPPRLADRRFVDLHPDNLDAVMSAARPRVTFRVENRLTDEPDPPKLGVELRFGRLNHLEPSDVARQFKPLRTLLDIRWNLVNLRGALQNNDKLDELLHRAIANRRLLRQVADELRVGGGRDE